VATSNFCRAAGSTQQIQLTRIPANNQVLINMVGDAASINDYDGQIIQEQGNGVDNNNGLMTIQSGSITLNAIKPATGEIEMNTVILDINTTGAITADSATTITLTSTGETEINCSTFDLNATADIALTAITTIGLNGTAIDIEATAGIASITSSGDTTILSTGGEVTVTSSTGNIVITSIGDNINLSSFAETQIDCGSLDINSSGTASIDATSNINITSATGGITIDTSTILSSINIGNATSLVYINGAVFMPNAINFSMIGSFFQQF